MLKAEPGEIALVEHATAAWVKAFLSLPLRSGDVVLTHAAEYAAKYVQMLQHTRARNAAVELIPSDKSLERRRVPSKSHVFLQLG